MKFTFEEDASLKEDEIVIKHNNNQKLILKLSSFLSNVEKASSSLKVYKDENEYYLDTKEFIFFETANGIVYAHTVNSAYEVKYKLYELEEMLANNFVRISKSSICNVNHIFSIKRNIASSNQVSFNNSNKKVYVSRMYYPILKTKLEKRLYNEFQK